MAQTSTQRLGWRRRARHALMEALTATALGMHLLSTELRGIEV